MKNLINKELRELFSSVVGAVIGVLFIISVYLFLWILPGTMNLFENGYATLDGFSTIVYNLLFVTIPLWAMNSYAAEQRYGTKDWLRSLPITETEHFASKLIAAWVGFGVLIALAFTVYFPILMLTQSLSDIDWGVVLISYFGIILLASYALSLNLFISSKIENPIASVLISMIANFVLFYGIGMIRNMIGSGRLFDAIAYLSPATYYQDWMKGVIDSRAIVFFVSFVLLFVFLSGKRIFRRETKTVNVVLIGIFVVINLFNVFYFVRFDCTQERLYSISAETKTKVKTIDRPVQVTLYLEGELNSGFRKLQQATQDLLLEYRTISKNLNLKRINPASISDFETTALYKNWTENGLNGVAVKETTSDGSFKQKLIYPYLELTDGTKSITINLLLNDPSKSGAENLNASIEQLEYVVTDGLSRLLQKEVKSIAFIEGHDEWDEPYLNGALNLLSRYYNIDRGQLEGAVEPLLPYKALIIADPKSAFSPQEIFVLDQYVNQGGSILWNVSPAEIKPSGEKESTDLTASIRDLGLNELFFSYGIRIKPNLIMDAQCTPIPLKLEGVTDIELAPWYYAPLLKPGSSVNYLKGITWVELPYCSTIELLDRKYEHYSIKPLLLTSSLSAECPLPHSVSLKHVTLEPNAQNFSKAQLTPAVLIEGILPLLYANRLSPVDQHPVVANPNPKKSKIVVVANGELFKNRVTVANDGTSHAYPLGFNPYLNEPTGNSDFVLNTVKYLCGDDDLLGLSRKQFRLRLLSKSKIESAKTEVRILAIAIPLILLASLSISVYVRRKKKNMKKGSFLF